MKPYLLYILSILQAVSVFGQTPTNREKFRIPVTQITEHLDIDGALNEAIWKQNVRAENFYRVLPIDTGFASAKTEVMVAYDHDNLYLGITCYDSLPGKRPVESLRRDFVFGKNDNFIVFMDTYNDQTNGFAFGVSAAGAQWDGIQANGGAVSLDWDIKWKSAVKNYDDRWTAEFAIPFRSIRYREGVTEWGINFSRLDLKRNEKSSWTPIPRQFATATLAFTGTLVWDKPLPKAGMRFSLIPYVSGKATQNLETGDKIKTNGSAGLDAKIMLSTSMNLDLTINPDYSQVEVDRQVTNLDRFELFYPEKRQFFLENSDLFSELGSANVRPFFSRRVGLNAPVIAGARLSGRLKEKWRIGLMNMQTAKENELPATNFSVAVLQRQVFKRSSVAAFFINKDIIESKNDTALNFNSYNRVAGIDFNLASTNNRWAGKAFYHQSWYPNAGKDAFTAATNLVYSTPKFYTSFYQAWVGADYLAETGYVRRRGYYELTPAIGYRFYPKSNHLINHGPRLDYTILLKPDLKQTDNEVRLTYSFEWKNKTILSTELKRGYVKLLAPFDPTNTGGVAIPADSEFKWNEVAAIYSSDTRKLLFVGLSVRYGDFYNGTRISINNELNYRWQPYGSLGIISSYNHIMLPKPYNSAELILIGPKLDITFTDKLFLTTFVQYNNQIDNINMNVRFQWRFAPVSDLFIVYTENTFPENFQSKNRGVVLKLSYWFN